MLLPSIFRNNFVDDFFDGFDEMLRVPSLTTIPVSRWMNTNVKDLGDDYQLEIELPGYDKKDITAELNKGYLTIAAKREDSKDEKDKKGNDTCRNNSGANQDLYKYIAEVNSTVLSKVKAKYGHAVVMSRQTGSVEFPYCINTFFEGGSWLRYDVTMPEMLYAAIHELPVEEQSDKSFAFTKLRNITETLRVEIEEFLKK